MADLPLGLAQVYVTTHLHSPRGQSRRKLALGTDTSGPRMENRDWGRRRGVGPGSQSCSVTHFFAAEPARKTPGVYQVRPAGRALFWPLCTDCHSDLTMC